MPVAFPNINPNTLVPLFYADVTSFPQPIASNLKMLLIGHMNNEESQAGIENDVTPGTAVANVPYILTGPDAVAMFGPGSQLSWMYNVARENAPSAEIWAIAITEAAPSATVLRAKGEIVVTAGGSRNRFGVLQFYIAGRPIRVDVQPTDTQHQIAEKIRKQINNGAHPIFARPVPNDPNPEANVVKVECNWFGFTGNEIRITHTGKRAHVEKTEPSAKLSRSLLNLPGTLAGGAYEHEVGDIFATVADMPFDVFVAPDTNTHVMASIENFMHDRWLPTSMMYGHTVSAKISDHQDLLEFGDLHNDPHHSVLAVQQSVCPPWEWASALAGVIVTHGPPLPSCRARCRRCSLRACS